MYFETKPIFYEPVPDCERLSSDEEQTDHISQRFEDSDTEQELTDNEEEEDSLSNKNQLYFTGRDRITKWSSQPLGILCKKAEPFHQFRVNSFARNAKTETECWKQFINDSMLEEILNHTNAKIKQRQSTIKDITNKTFTKETTKDELLALFGLMYIAGQKLSDRQNINDLWRSDGTGVDIFRTTMALQRFYFLRNNLRFVNATICQERKEVDNLAPIRSIFEQFVSNCKTACTPSEYLTIDEKLEAFRGKCPFRQFIPKKPAKYGIKIYVLVDSIKHYTVNLEIYPGAQPVGPFSQSNEAFDVVDRLVQPISKSNRNVTFDSWFTNIPLVAHLQNQHKLTATGAIRKDKKEIPSNFITKRGKDVHSSQFAFQKDMTLVSYVPNKSKVVLVLSSLHHDQSIDPASGDKQKPKIITFYDSTKTGVDALEEFTAPFDVSRNFKRSWPMAVFYMLLNIAALNSEIVYSENNKLKTKKRDYITKLGLSMLEGHLCMRRNVENLPTELRKRIKGQTGESIDFPPVKGTKKYRRCKDCPSAKDKKTRYDCRNCNKPICLQHIIPLCRNCTEFDGD